MSVSSTTPSFLLYYSSRPGAEQGGKHQQWGFAGSHLWGWWTFSAVWAEADKWSPICALQQSEIAKVRAHEALIPHVKAEILSFSMEVHDNFPLHSVSWPVFEAKMEWVVRCSRQYQLVWVDRGGGYWQMKRMLWGTLCQWVYIVGKAMKRSKEKKGPKAGGTLTPCHRHSSNTHQNEWGVQIQGSFFILTMPSTYYLELKTQELPPNYLTESKE